MEPVSNTPKAEELIDQQKVKKTAQLRKQSKKWLGIGIIAVLVCYVAVMFIRNKDVYARVGTQVITKQQYGAALDSYRSYGKRSQNTVINADVEKYTREQLILEKSLENDARANNVPLLTSEIASEVRSADPKITSADDTEAIRQYQAVQAQANELSADNALRPIRISVLQKKLASKLLSTVDVLSVTTRWDYNPDRPQVSDEEVDRKARETLEKRYLPLFERKASTEEILQNSATIKNYEENEDYKINPDTAYSEVLTGLSASVGLKQFADPKDKEAILALKNIGDYTSVTRSEGGYYYIYRLENKTGGQFADWDSYTKDAQARARIFGTGLSPQILIASTDSPYQCRTADSGQSVLSRVLAFILPQPAEACPGTPGESHWTGYGGQILDSGGAPVANATLTITQRGGEPAGDFCGGLTSGSTTTNASGGFLTSREYSCYVLWQATISNVPAGCSIASVQYSQGNPGGADFSGLTFKLVSVEGQSNGKYSPAFHTVRLNCQAGKSEAYIGFKTIDQNGNVSPSFNNPPVAAGACLQIPGNFCKSNSEPVLKGPLSSTNTGYFGVSTLVAPNTGWVVDRVVVQYPDSPYGWTELQVTPYLAAGKRTYVTVYFRKLPPPNVDLTVNGLDNPPNPVEIESDTSIVVRWTVGGGPAKSCTASTAVLSGPAIGSPWSGPKAVGGGNENRSSDASVDDREVRYRIECSGDGGDSNDDVVVRYRRRFNPWVQTKRGDVMVKDQIIGQTTGINGGRNTADVSTKEAEYVIISRISTNFCSLNRMAFGLEASSDLDACKNKLYTPNVSPEDDIYGNINKYGNRPAGITSCPATPSDGIENPYQVENSMITSGVINSEVNCAKIWRPADGDRTIGGLTITKGRATLWIKGNLTITGDIRNDFAAQGGNYNENLLPNLGIIVEGDIIIRSNVARIDAMLYASGKIKTCEGYPSQSCNQSLSVVGSVGATRGFELGRNFYASGGPNRSSNQPAELFAGAAQGLIYPAPGFEDRYTPSATEVQYLYGELNPRF